jgi:outer membrane protein
MRKLSGERFAPGILLASRLSISARGWRRVQLARRIRSCGHKLYAGLMALGAIIIMIPAHAETLADALSATYQSNPRLDAARAIQRATDEEVPRAKAGYRPSITGEADYGYRKVWTNPVTSNSGDTRPGNYNASVSQPLFNGFQTVNAVSGAEATVRAGRETLRTTEQSVLLAAVTAYGDVSRDQSIVVLSENNVTVLTRDLRATQDRFNVGEVTRTDVAQAQARRAAAVAALDLAKANLKTSRAIFQQVVGHPPGNLVEARESKLVPKALADSIKISLRESPNVVGALYLEQAARFAVEQIKGELLPSAELDASYTKNLDPLPALAQVETSIVTGRMTVPVYTGGEVQARVRQAKQTHVQRLQEIEQARAQTQAEVVTAWSQYVAAKAAVESDQTAVKANRVALAGVREEERVGQRTLLDVLNAEQELLNAEVNLVTDQRNLVVASYTVLSSMGRLNAQELGVSSLVYDAEAHYHEVRNKWFDINITHGDGRRESIASPER